MDEYEKNKMQIKRPDINPCNGIIKIIAVITLMCIMYITLYYFKISLMYGLVINLFVIAFYMKKTIIWLILLYQKYAPERIRASCVFTPTCSNYMILVINKYGLFKGLIKGIKRLFRCHYPNGGIDNP